MLLALFALINSIGAPRDIPLEDDILVDTVFQITDSMGLQRAYEPRQYGVRIYGYDADGGEWGVFWHEGSGKVTFIK